MKPMSRKARNKKMRLARTVRAQAFIRAAKDVPCADCGRRYPYYVMDFDHVKGKKKFSISMKHGATLVMVAKEIEKCEVVCSNCHRIRTHKRSK